MIKGLITIGIPAYERPESLQRILNCALEQTYAHIEILVSDDASSNPEIQRIAQEFALRDSRVKYRRQEKNLGVLANVDYLMKWANGEFFTIFSDDDWRAPEFIELLKSKLDSNPKSLFAFCDYREVDESGKPILDYPKSHLGIFKPFESNFKWYRLVTYYLQDAKKGKPNLFYALFRRSAVASMDLQKISGGFKNFNMDCLISYSVLKKSSLLIVRELLCTLTCGNKKHYSSKDSDKQKPSISSFYRFYKSDQKTYQALSDNFLEHAMVSFLFWPKIASLFLSHVIKKMAIQFKSIKKRELAPISQSAKNKLKLPMVTLVAMTSVNVEETVEALKHSCLGIDFGSVKLLSHYKPFNLDSTIQFHRVSNITSIDDWCERIIYDLHQYIETDYIVLVHADGFVVNPEMWRQEFLEYDYIGAPWPLPRDNFSYRDIHGNIIRVGNSVSLRSKRILKIPAELGLPWEPDHGYFHEDGFLCVQNRHILLEHGIKYAPMDVAKYFSHEIMIPEIKNIKPFAFHKWAGSNSIYPKFK